MELDLSPIHCFMNNFRGENQYIYTAYTLMVTGRLEPIPGDSGW